MKGNTPSRLFDFAYYQLEHFPKEDALASKVKGHWVKTSSKSFVDQATQLSLGLLKMGIKPGDRIAMISNNRTEWNITDLAIQQIGGINVPVYPTASAEDYIFIFNDAGVRLCFVSDEELYNKVKGIKAQIPSLEEIFTYERVAGADHWTDVLNQGHGGNPEDVRKLSDAVKPEDLATLIYTSGTTGQPKGVMLSHNNIVSNALASRERLPVNEYARAVSFLPLCHIYERMLIYLYAYTGVSIYYAESMETIGDNIREVKPEVFSAVPRLLEKVYGRIMEKGAALTGVKRMLFFWAVELAKEYDVQHKSSYYHFKLKIARKLIFSKWMEALGGEVKAIASGSAALNPRLARIFLGAGIKVLEGYGLTETSPVVSVNGPNLEDVRIGCVGRPISHVQVKIAEDGEILIKGPNVMMGYYKRPDLTADVIKDGWFHTGDIGTMVEGEFLKITDRKKEIFKTSGGKYITPQIIENSFKESRFIEQIMVIGENKKHPAALIQPDFVFLKDWAARKNISYGSNAELIAHPKVMARVEKEIEEINGRFGQWERIKKFELTPELWSVDGGELTPTLKLRRKPIMDKYKDLVVKIYGDE